jgi:hypothetical protein
MTQGISLQKPAPAWFYAFIEWVQRWQFAGKKQQEENYFLIH